MRNLESYRLRYLQFNILQHLISMVQSQFVTYIPPKYT